MATKIINKCNPNNAKPTGLIRYIENNEFKAQKITIADNAPCLNWKSKGWMKPILKYTVCIQNLRDYDCKEIWYKRGTYSGLNAYVR